jgi:hypothetical protein
MIRSIALSAVVLAVAGSVWGADPSDNSRAPAKPTNPDRSFGTALQWEKQLDSAGKKADREHKLLMVLAVAGHFEDPFFT